MGRKRKLSPEHLQRLLERHLAGESIRSLAREADMSESSLRALISAQSAQIKTAANHLVAAEQALTKMSVSAQITARSLASKLMRAMDNLATGSELMGGSFLKLAMAHNAAVSKVDDSDPMSEDSQKAMVAAGVLGKLANQAAEIPIRLVAVMKDGIAGEEDEEGGAVIRVVGGLPD